MKVDDPGSVIKYEDPRFFLIRLLIMLDVYKLSYDKSQALNLFDILIADHDEMQNPLGISANVIWL